MIAQHLDQRRFLQRWLCLWLGIPTVMMLLAIASFGGPIALFGLLLELPLFLIWGGLCLYCSVWALQLLLNEQYIRCALLLLAPLSLLAFVKQPAPFFTAGSYIRFAIEKPFFDALVAQQPDNGFRAAVFEWVPGWDVDEVVVYDESGQLLLPLRKRSPMWGRGTSAADILSVCTDDVHPLWGHYYLAQRPC